jgi:hypothetical protein
MEAHQVLELDKAECLQLLGAAPFGRIVYTRQALPAVRLVNHVLIDEDLVMAADLGLRDQLASAGTIVAYHADGMDPARQAGWSVVAIGRAFLAGEELTRRYRAAARPWLDAAGPVVTVHPELATGFRLLPAGGSAHERSCPLVVPSADTARSRW